jgi:hypothetical protein
MNEIQGFKYGKWLISVPDGGHISCALLTSVFGPIWTGSARAKGSEMSVTLSSARISWPLMLTGLLVGLLLAATLGLWAYYGAAVFFEMVRNGWAACF